MHTCKSVCAGMYANISVCVCVCVCAVCLRSMPSCELLPGHPCDYMSTPAPAHRRNEPRTLVWNMLLFGKAEQQGRLDRCLWDGCCRRLWIFLGRRFSCLRCLQTDLRHRLRDLGDCRRPDKKAMLWLAVEVGLALDTTIVLALLFVQLNAHPLASCKLCGADELHSAA